MKIRPMETVPLPADLVSVPTLWKMEAAPPLLLKDESVWISSVPWLSKVEPVVCVPVRKN